MQEFDHDFKQGRGLVGPGDWQADREAARRCWINEGSLGLILRSIRAPHSGILSSGYVGRPGTGGTNPPPTDTAM